MFHDLNVHSYVYRLYIQCFLRRVPQYFDENANTTWSFWEPINNPKKIQFLQLQDQIQMIEDPFVDRMEFWNSLNLTDMKPWRQ